MDAVLRPHRSLSVGAFRAMAGIVLAANVTLAAVFLAKGALPVAGFLGLDVVALWVAFRWNYRSARVEEHVCVTPGKVYVAAIDEHGAARHWVLNPIWARVLREGRGVLIRAGATQMRLGSFLSPRECEEFAAALSTALHQAKRGGV